MKFLAAAGRHLIFEHTAKGSTPKIMSCDTLLGSVTPMPSVPVNADVYAGSDEHHANGHSFLAIATNTDTGVDCLCVDVTTSKQTTPYPFWIEGCAVVALHASAACVAVATERSMTLIDPLTNRVYKFDPPTDIVALAAWRTDIGAYAGDYNGNVYAVSPIGVWFVGATPPRLLNLHALADRSCLANTETHTSVLFEKNGRCIDFQRKTPH